MKNIIKFSFIILFSCACFKGVCQRNLMSNDNWYEKVDKSLQLIQKNDLSLYNEVISASFIQAAELNYYDNPSGIVQTCGISILEYRSNQPLHWILINSEQLNQWNINKIAAVIVHEALHLKYWNHGVDGKYYNVKSESDMFREHVYIYNYELQFLKKINAPKSDLEPCQSAMAYLSIPIQ